MLEIGFVEDTAGNTAKIRMRRTSMCASCGKCGLLSAGGSSDLIIEARNDRGALPGDWVRVEMDSSSVLLAAFLVYIVPLMAGALGYPVGVAFSRGVTLLISAETCGILGILFFFFASFGIIRAYDRRARNTRRFLPVVKEIIQSET